jgi:Flp pilus assembly protein TadD
VAHSNLGNALREQGKVAEAIAAYREAIRLQPDRTSAHSNLGLALLKQGKVAEATAEFREAIRLRPDDAVAHSNLGNALRAEGKVAEAIAAYREAIRLQPDLAVAHSNLGEALHKQGKVDEAIAAFREAIRLRPDFAAAHSNLGAILCGVKHDYPGAEAELRAAIRLRPDFAVAHYNLGNALRAEGKVAEAIATYREAIRLQPDRADAYCNLGRALQRNGHFQEALVELRKGHELGSKRPDWRYPSAEWVRQAEPMAALEGRLPAVLRGEEKPGDAAEGLAFAVMAFRTERYGASARLYAEALRTDPKRAEEMRSSHRYNAACAAALAGTGRGEDSPPAEAERARWRQQAVAWLEADLGSWGNQAESGKPDAKAAVVRTLLHWKKDTDLAGIRDPAALAKLPAVEQKAWRALWADVDALLQKAQGDRR